uniref:Uncharacterized protein n=1 Tax=Physcomitrium patens TaxID=3218 RepID=A0A2K1ISS7_PHYPA|nr:hypothetical protein PHYPA_026456 [Physcomitrium patens]
MESKDLVAIVGTLLHCGEWLNHTMRDDSGKRIYRGDACSADPERTIPSTEFADRTRPETSFTSYHAQD